MKSTKCLKDTVRNPYAWPGGYAKVGIMSDGDVLCVECLREEYRLIYRSTRDGERDGWQFIGADIHWEGDTIYCAHCNKEIPSEYGPIE